MYTFKQALLTIVGLAMLLLVFTGSSRLLNLASSGWFLITSTLFSVIVGFGSNFIGFHLL